VLLIRDICVNRGFFCQSMTDKSIEERIDRLQAGGVIDMHFDLPMDLYEKRERKNVLETEFLPEFEAGNVGVVGVAIYIEDRYLPDAGLRVALDQIARLYAETQACSRFAICKSYREMQQARAKARCSSRSRELSRSGRIWIYCASFTSWASGPSDLHTREAMRRDMVESLLRAVHRRRALPKLVVIWCENAKRSA
jgi:hypothetical protein